MLRGRGYWNSHDGRHATLNQGVSNERETTNRGHNLAVAAAVILIPGSTFERIELSVVEYRKSFDLSSWLI